MSSEQINVGAFQAMQQDIGEMKSLMGRVVDALAKFAVIEERQDQTARAHERIVGRLEAMEQRQHQADIASALARDHADRIGRLEQVAREAHVESERQKAKFGAFTWSMRAVWTAGAAVVGVVAWIFKNTPWIAQ